MATAGFASSANFITFSSGSAGANSIFLTKVTLNVATTVSAVLLNIPAATSSIQFKALIYDGAHSALLATGSTVTALATGYNRLPLTASVALSVGTYFVGYACNSALNVSLATLTSASWFVSGGQSVTTPANPLVGGVVSNNCVALGVEFDGTTAQGYGWGVDYSSGSSLSSSNTIGTVPAAGSSLFASVRSVVTHDTPGTGKFYAEVVPSVASSTVTFIGVGSANVNMGNIGSTTSSALYIELLRSDGQTTGVTAGIATGLSYAPNDVIGIAYDATNGLVWFNKNNGAYQGNGAGSPSAGTNGLAVTPGNWPVGIFATMVNTAGSFTLRDYTASQQYTAPSGFSAWSSYVPAAAPGTQARVMVMA